jgi:amino acid transporter
MTGADPVLDILTTIPVGMGYAGTAGMVWGWIIAMLFIQCVAAAMAELCSSMPTR